MLPSTRSCSAGSATLGTFDRILGRGGGGRFEDQDWREFYNNHVIIFQNNAARLVFRKSKRNHVTPLLLELHWLPVQYRIQYKIATFAFRRFDNTLPPYLSSLLNIYQPPRSLRSSSEKLLSVPKVCSKTFGQRSFQYQAPLLWNSLPTEIRDSRSLTSFKNHMKTHRLKKAFSL